MAERVGAKREIHSRGWYVTKTMVDVTPALQAAMVEWAAKPRRRYRLDDMALTYGSIFEEHRAANPDDIPF
ncbi:MAG: hypothetical protein INR70_14270 [Parafilimonas terrae]|nr:hypothetical protein [Parafilimonas terrae]